MRSRGLAVVGSVVLLSAGCGALGPGDPVGDPRGLLARAVDAAEARDWDGLCSLEGADRDDCLADLHDEGLEATVPERPPRVVCERTAGSGTSALRILTVEGTDAAGVDYTFDFAVRHSGEVAEAVFWRTLSWSPPPEGSEVSTDRTPAACP